MTCKVVQTGDITAIVCSRGASQKRYKCSVCGQPATLLCDWKIGNGKTCDVPVCHEHTYRPAPGKDLCWAHSNEWLMHLRKINEVTGP